MIKTNKLVILGAGGFGREVYAWLLDLISQGTLRSTNTAEWIISGFIDDSGDALNGFSDLPPILSTVENFVPADDIYVVCAIANPRVKKTLTDKLKVKGTNFYTLLHPTVIVGPRVKIGEGSVICPFTVLSTDLVVGDFVTINSSCTIGHDTLVSDFCTLSGHCDVTGGGKLLEGAFLGSHAVVVPKVVVGEYAVVGAGSVAIRKVAPGVTVFGVPAKRISG
ncbi:transferase [Pseudomonas sp. FSL R10-1350]|nr:MULTISPECIES: NeuD/PglB/VioB family sugar acetyltransferase [unclassified Pseudomonas]MQT58771.1 transferase [Pseudomonas sp. FSL R10-0399]MQU62760.1 transferase [Pseudomonas sp. FSL R10-1350]